MKITYTFANETIEIDVEDEWGNTLIDLNRKEYNIDHKETRRHTSLNNMEYEGDIFIDEINIEDDFIKTLENENIRLKLEYLLPQQKELIYLVYFKGETLSDIARKEGVSKMAITNRMKKIHEKLKKLID